MADWGPSEREPHEDEPSLPSGEVGAVDHPGRALDLDPARHVEPHHRPAPSKDSANPVPYGWADMDEEVHVDVRMLIECPCGAVLEGADIDAVVETATGHARDVHDMSLTDEQARAMARPV